MQISRITDISHDESASGSLHFEMPGVVSEWLFSTGFWARFNAQNGTIFDQFEEDEADVAVVTQVASALLAEVTSVETCKQQIVEFAFRRLPDGSAVTASITKENLLEELKSLHRFLQAAAEQKLTLLFSL
jgi:hypothetical protein